MNTFKRNVPLLAISQALMVSAISLILTTAALVGASLAEDKSLATLPVALMAIAAMFTTIPASMLMEKIGRKNGFMLACLFGIGGSLLSAFAILESDFWLFTMGSLFLGVFNGFGNYYRFSAADAVPKAQKSRAISLVMLGGVVAAFVGTNLANLTHDLFDAAPFAGSYAALTGFYVLSLLSLSFLKLPPHLGNQDDDSVLTQRPLLTIMRQPKFIVALICGAFGYAVMSLIMTATPLAMSDHQHAFQQISFVIQWHLLGMFVPSFFTGSFIAKFGVLKVMAVGAVLGMACVIINLLGTSSLHFMFALILLGMSWNFLFIGATTLLTQTYTMAERGKAQAANDFIVFTCVAIASLTAGYLHFNFGWKVVNMGVLPLLLLILISIIVLGLKLKNETPCKDNKDDSTQS